MCRKTCTSPYSLEKLVALTRTKNLPVMLMNYASLRCQGMEDEVIWTEAGLSPRRGGEERLSTARPCGRYTHVFCIPHVTVRLLPHCPSLGGTPENVISDTNTSQGSQQERQESPRPVSVHFSKGTGHILLPPLTFQGAFLLLVICNAF